MKLFHRETGAAALIAALDKSQAIIEFDLNGKILGANANFCSAMGYAPEEIIGRHHSIFVDPAYAESADYKAFWEKLRSGMFDRQQYLRIGKGGREVWIQASYNPVRDAAGKLVKVVKLATDITARVKAINTLGDGLAILAKGDLTARIGTAFPDDLERLRADFNQAAQSLQTPIADVAARADAIGGTAQAIRQASEDLSHRTEQQAASLEETAAALEEITATIKSTAQNAKSVGDMIASARGAAEEGSAVVTSAVSAMELIQQSSRQITDIIGVIDEIAFQTNLLALNAGVEAARAGDAGRGFAVVASEVRALAQRSSEAAREIKTLIKASGEHVRDGVREVGATGTALTRIAHEVAEADRLVAEMVRAVQQQATGVAEVNTAVGQLDQVTQSNAAMVEETTASAESLLLESQGLLEGVSFFSTGKSTPSVQAPAAVRRRRAA